MYGTLQNELVRTLSEIREAGLYKSELPITTPQGAHVDVEGRGELLNLCAQQLPRPGQPPGDRRGRARGARPLGLRHGIGALHLRHPGAPPGARRAPLSVPRHRRHDPLQLLLRRERRSLRGAARRGGRRHLRPAQPRLDHRRDPALQGAAAALRERRHGRARGTARGVRRRPPPADRDRRRLLDGRLPRAARPHLRARRAPRRARHGRRLACRRRRRPRRSRHARAPRRRRARRHRHGHARQGDRRRQRRLRLRPPRDRRAAPSARAALSLLEQPRAASRRRQPARARADRELATSCATASARTPPASAPA